MMIFIQNIKDNTGGNFTLSTIISQTISVRALNKRRKTLNTDEYHFPFILAGKQQNIFTCDPAIQTFMIHYYSPESSSVHSQHSRDPYYA